MTFKQQNPKIVMRILMALSAATVFCWFMGVHASFGKRPPLIFLQGATGVLPHDRFPLRVTVLDDETRQKLDRPVNVGFTGGEDLKLAKDSVARLDVAGVGKEPSITVVMQDGTREFQYVSPLKDTEYRSTSSSFTFSPWWKELKRPGPLNELGPPIYPVHGRLPSMLQDSYFTLNGDTLTLNTVRPNPARTLDNDNREMNLSRHNILLEIPVSAAPGALLNVRIHTMAAVDAYVDIFLDGQLRDMQNFSLEPGKHDIAMRVPDDALPGTAYAVRLTDSVFSKERGRMAYGIVSKNGPLDFVAISDFMKRFGDTGDPLLESLLRQDVQWSPSVARALLSRLKAEHYRPAQIGLSAPQQRRIHADNVVKAIDVWRLPFRLFGSALCLFLYVYAGFSVSRQRAWEKHEEESPLEAPIGVQGGHLKRVWAILVQFLALSAAFAVLWVMDIAISFGTF